MASKSQVNVETIGHVEHGKTTLTAAITNVLAAQGKARAISYSDIDRASEEKERGVSINSAHVVYETTKQQYAHIDYPSDVDYVKHMLTRSGKVDGAILVVSATDGPQLQTYEHIALLQKCGVSNLVVYLNKCDQVDDEDVFEFVEDEVRILLTKYGFKGDDIFIIRGSALMALNGQQDDNGYGVASIAKLMDAMDSVITSTMANSNHSFLLPIEDAATITGRGTVLTGKIESGVVNIGDELEIVGLRNGTLKTSVMGIELFKKSVGRASSGDNAGILLRALKKEDVERGMVLATPGSIKTYTTFKAVVYILKTEEGGRRTPFQARWKPQFYFRTADINGEITELMDAQGQQTLEITTPGDFVSVTINLSTNVALVNNLNFAVREGGRTVGIGKIIEMLA